MPKAAGGTPEHCLQNIYAVDRGYGKDGIPLIFKLDSCRSALNHAEFAFQNFRQEIAVPQAGSRKRESIRSVSCFTKSSMALTSRLPVNTSP